MFCFQQLNREYEDNSKTPENHEMTKEVHLIMTSTGNSPIFYET